MRSIELLLLLGAVAFAGCRQEPEPSPPPPLPEAPKVAPAPPLEPQAQGTIEGTVFFEGTAPPRQPQKRGADPACSKQQALEETVLVTDGKLQNVLVRIKEPVAAPSPQQPVVIDQIDCMYRPRVIGAVKGQPLQVKNSNGTLHNVHTFLQSGKTWFNQAQPPKAPDIVRPIDQDGLIKLKCDVHPWMVGYVLVSNSPFFATTGPDGRFVLSGVPEGTYTLEAWHEKYAVQTATVTVKAAERATTHFTFRER